MAEATDCSVATAAQKQITGGTNSEVVVVQCKFSRPLPKLLQWDIRWNRREVMEVETYLCVDGLRATTILNS